ncbi:MAG: T9SS type A sorting domain-containing protein [Bacteroidota bacterium]
MKTSIVSFISILFLCTIFIEGTIKAQYYNSKRHLSRGADTAEIYISCQWYVDTSGIIWNGLFRSVDNGESLSLQRKTNYWEECGMILGDSVSGALFQYTMHHQDTFGVSYDYGVTFERKFFNDIYYSTAGCMAGEIYFVIWYNWMEIYLFHTFDYGQTVTFQSQLPPSIGEETYTAGSTPGSFYHVQREVCGTPPYVNSCLHIRFSRDYGVTFTEYFHFLDSTYTGISSSLQEQTDIFCYPNPTSGQLTIRFENGFFTDIDLQLVDLTGRIRLSSTIPKNRDQVILDLSTVRPGIYLVKLFSEGNNGKKVIGAKKLVVE